MNLVFVFPFCSPGVNSISGGPIYLGSSGHKVLVVTAQHSMSLKGDVSAPPHESIDGTEFYRPYPESNDLLKRPGMCWNDVRRKVEEFRPDAIVGFGEFNYRLPLRLSREFSVPYFLYLEYLRPEKIGFPMRGRSLLKKVAPAVHNWLAKRFMRSLSRHLSAIMYAYYGDKVYADVVQQYGVPVHYVPWCSDVGFGDCATERNRKVGIYIGSLDAFKNAAELVKAIPLILDNTATERFIVVGPGEFAGEVKRLAERYGDRLKYIQSVPRQEAMQLICSAGYGYTPVRDCGLGFIGDCWGTGTPLLATHDLEGFLSPGVDALIADGYEDLPRVVGTLLDSADLYKRLQRDGRARYNSSYTSKAVGEKYLEIISGSAGTT